ncbi:hypothetical protein EU555_04680 [Methylobacterium nonmethylotrophicum]|uniref:Uncharacterized protein n=1 Tax=Methylobacterium nonmethylotrophicum TaxID=1141884 RepID=A0A4Z0NXB1_9HYPH|nr:hypothetical protein EU555_04680 [Methylobacterium nonmethylotrophicum]
MVHHPRIATAVPCRLGRKVVLSSPRSAHRQRSGSETGQDPGGTSAFSLLIGLAGLLSERRRRG